MPHKVHFVKSFFISLNHFWYLIFRVYTYSNFWMGHNDASIIPVVSLFIRYYEFPTLTSTSPIHVLCSIPVRTSIFPSPNHQQAWLQEVYLDMMYCQPWGGFESFCHILLFLLFFLLPIAVVCSPSCSRIVLTVFSSCSLSKQSVNHRAEWVTVHPCDRGGAREFRLMLALNQRATQPYCVSLDAVVHVVR